MKIMSSQIPSVNHAKRHAELIASAEMLSYTNQKLVKHKISSSHRKILMYLKKKALGILGVPRLRYSVSYSLGCPGPWTVRVDQPSEYNAEIQGTGGQLFEPQMQICGTITVPFEEQVEPVEGARISDAEVEMNKAKHQCFLKALRLMQDLDEDEGEVLFVSYNGINVPVRHVIELNQLCTNREPSTLRFSVGSDHSLLGGGPPKRKTKKKSRKRRPKGSREDGNVVASQLGLRNPPWMYKDLPPIKDFWTVDQVLEADGSGQVSTFFSLFDPNQAINGTVVYQRAADLSKIFDEYRVNSVVVLLENFVQSTTLATFRFAVDYDSTPSGLYTYDSLADNSTMREYSGTNQATYTVRPPRMTTGTKNGTQVTIYKGGWMDFATPPDEGFIVLAGKNFVPSQKYSVTIRIMVQCRRRRTINVARDEILEKEQEKLLKRKSK